MSEHGEVGLDPTALERGHAHIAQWHDAARAYLRLQRFTSREVFHNLRAHQAVGVVVLICRKVSFYEAAFVKDQQRKTEHANFVSRQIVQARRIGKRLLQLFVCQSPMCEPHHRVQNRPDIHGEVEVLQPRFRRTVAPAQIVQRSARQRCGHFPSCQDGDDVVDADFARDGEVDVVENVPLQPAFLRPTTHQSGARDETEQIGQLRVEPLHFRDPQHGLQVLIADALQILRHLLVGQLLQILAQGFEVGLIQKISRLDSQPRVF